jgi:hypothetical protein
MFFPCVHALFAGTETQQIIPGINAGIVAIFPFQLNRIRTNLPDSRQIVPAGSIPVLRNGSVTSEKHALTAAGSAWTCIPKFYDSDTALMAILPGYRQFLRQSPFYTNGPHGYTHISSSPIPFKPVKYLGEYKNGF